MPTIQELREYKNSLEFQTTQKPKTFEFSVLPLWEGIAVFLIFAFLFVFPAIYFPNWTGLIIRIYFPLLCLCALGYCRVRTQKLSIEMFDNHMISCCFKNKLLVVPCNETKIFYARFYNRKIGFMLRIKNRIFCIYTEDFGREKIKQYNLNINELQSIIGNNSHRKWIDFVPFVISLFIYMMIYVSAFAILFFVLYLIAIFTDNTHWFDFLKSLL